jgi:hypothetical protein
MGDHWAQHHLCDVNQPGSTNVMCAYWATLMNGYPPGSTNVMYAYWAQQHQCGVYQLRSTGVMGAHWCAH